ncbi:MAG: type I methionyl aminopeptidase [Patescibacteria group bacterium]
MISLKTKKQTQTMKEGGRILSHVVNEVARSAKEGVVLRDLDELARKLIKSAGAEPAFLGYQPPWGGKAFPAAICTSINEVVVHGLPNERKLRSGDILTVDCGVSYRGFYTDMAVTVGIGDVSQEAQRLIDRTRKILYLVIKECRVGKTLGDVGWMIEDTAKKNGLRPVKVLTGHGIGKKLHEDPTVFNWGERGKGVKLEEGMTIAIEPMLTVGQPDIVDTPAGVATKDGSITAHFEHTVAVTKSGPLILTE